MKITAATTDEQILEGVRYARTALAEAADPDNTKFDAERLGDLANAVATAEGRAYARAAYRDMLAYGASPEEAQRALMDLLFSVDDKWSGRGNDNRRCRADGIRDEVRTLTRGY
jgi:hypothetical protein